MKVPVGSCLTIVLLFFAFTFTAISEPYLKIYERPTIKISAGFVPYKAQVVMGEPLQVTFIVKNLGQTNFEFWYDWNHKGPIGHSRLQITVTDSHGRLLPDPYAYAGGSYISSMGDFRPGQTFSNVIDLTDFCVLDKPGAYVVNCSFRFDPKNEKPSDLFANSTFNLTIFQRTPQRVTDVLDELDEKAKTSHGHDLNDTLVLMASFGKGDAISRLGSLAKKGPAELRTAAIGALALVPSDATLKILLAEFRDPDPAIRAAAAGSLGIMQDHRAVDALLNALPNEQTSVAKAILPALGASKSDRAFQAITNVLDTGKIEWQHAAIKGLVNFDSSNAVLVLKQHINTNYLPLRYQIVLALAEQLHQPIEAEWLSPVLVGREQNGEWLDSLRLLRLYTGDQAIPALLSYLDFDVAWSQRNWWILNEVEACPKAPHVNYEHDPNSDGTPEQWTNNLRILQSLRSLAGPIHTPMISPAVPPVQNLQTDPSINFTPSFKEIGQGAVEIKSGFLTLDLSRSIQNMPYLVPDSYRSVYEDAHVLRSLSQDSKKLSDFKISSEQLKQLNDSLHEFAVKLCGSNVSAQKIGNLYNSLVFDPGYCPVNDDWYFLFPAYKEAPPSLQEQTKADLINSVQAFSQNYHSGTVEFVQAARKIFSQTQLDQILK